MILSRLTTTWRTNCFLPFVDGVAQVHAVGLGGRLGAPLEGGIGESLSKYCARMVSRSTATLNSLKGWPATELSARKQIGFIQVLDAIHLQAADEVLRAFLDIDEDGDVARLALIVVRQCGESL